VTSLRGDVRPWSCAQALTSLGTEGGHGADRVFAGPGNDRVRVVSTERATMQVGLVVWCGPGFDQVVGGTRAMWDWGFIKAHGRERIDPST
jgi:hypothetical protein